MPPKRYTDEEWAAAESMLRPRVEGGEGMTFAEVARQTGITSVTLYRKFPQYKRNPDPPPGGNKSVKGKAKDKGQKGFTDEQMMPFYGKVASLPAVPMKLWLHCDFCANHFAKTGPDAAQQLLAMSADNQYLRAGLEQFYSWFHDAAWAGVLLMWMGVPIAHHALPGRADGVYRLLQAFGVLPRDEDVQEFHAQHAGNGGAPANPFESMDIGSLFEMASSMGVKIDPLQPGIVLQEVDDESDVEIVDGEPTEPDTEQTATDSAEHADDADTASEAVEEITTDSNTSE